MFNINSDIELKIALLSKALIGVSEEINQLISELNTLEQLKSSSIGLKREELDKNIRIVNHKIQILNVKKNHLEQTTKDLQNKIQENKNRERESIKSKLKIVK